MVNASRASWRQAGEPLHLGLVFDASVRLQTSRILYQVVSEHRDGMVSPMVHPSVRAQDAVSLTGPCCNRLSL